MMYVERLSDTKLSAGGLTNVLSFLDSRQIDYMLDYRVILQILQDSCGSRVKHL